MEENQMFIITRGTILQMFQPKCNNTCSVRAIDEAQWNESLDTYLLEVTNDNCDKSEAKYAVWNRELERWEDYEG
ncbi:MAG: hypothetical protein KAS32_15555 [Candidatus Peribacteraceae bacterium]|nr:hypothetical protein [Candidatus Peribacteraceae bacterium]